MNEIERREELIKDLIEEFKKDEAYKVTLEDVEFYLDQYDEGLLFDVATYLLFKKLKEEVE